MKSEKVSKQRVEEILKDILDPQTFIYNIRIRHKSPDPEIEIQLDQMGGLNLQECAQIHRKFSKSTDASIFDDYQISFSTPGIDRRCVYPHDFLLHQDRNFHILMKDQTEIRGLVEILDRSTETLRIIPENSEPVEIFWKDVSVARFILAAEEIR